MRWLLLLAATLVCSSTVASACDVIADTEDAVSASQHRCEVAGGYYIAAAPRGWNGSSMLPLVAYFHGWNGSPEGTFRNRAMTRAVHRRGAMFVALYAPGGYWRQIGEGRAEGGRDELTFVHAVMADVRKRWPIDDARTLASGFSRGASMVWNVACYAGPLFRAYAPIAGGFWGSTPESCPSGPVSLRHIHGTRDRVVAYEEVGVYNSMPIPEGMAMLRGLNGCPAEPNQSRKHRRYMCTEWTQCTSEEALAVCLHDRGHSIPAEWVAEGFDWMIALEN